MSTKRADAAAKRAGDDFPEIPADLLARMKPSRRGRPPAGEAPKEAISLRIDPDVLAAYKAQGAGWQSLMHQTLKRAAGRLTKPGNAEKRAAPKAGAKIAPARPRNSKKG
jgi:uncharacterized protein (DUF4415 family)